MFEVEHKVRVVNVKPLGGRDTAPKLTLGEEKTVHGICLDKDGNQHLDVGLVSDLNYVTSFETGEQLPNGNLIHWCHPSRFELIK